MANLSNFFSPFLSKELKQTGMIKSSKGDAGRRALPPGKRISRTGKIYWETRANRSDKVGSNL